MNLLTPLLNSSIEKLIAKRQRLLKKRLLLWALEVQHIGIKTSNTDTENGTASTWPVKQLARLKVMLGGIFTVGIKSHIFESV